MGLLNPAARRFVQSESSAPAVSPLTPFQVTRSLPRAGTEEELRRASVADLQRIQAPELAPGTAKPLEFNTPNTVPIRDELRYSNFSNVPLNIGIASVRVLLKPSAGSRRVYLMIVNTDPANTLFVNFGQDATLLNGVPLVPNFGAWEFNTTVPQDDIYLIGSAAGTSGVLTFSNDSVAGVRA